jgi:hypothetical protein
MIPDNLEVKSVVINFEQKPLVSNRYNKAYNEKKDFHLPFKSEEPDEGLLYEELY